MPFSSSEKSVGRLARVFVVGLGLLVSACGGSQANLAAGETNDPYEETNRATHAFNKDVDKFLFAPVSNGYGGVTTTGIRGALSNFSSHLSLPNDVINNVLQGDLDSAATNTGRFAMNTVVGFAGIFDPASDVNLERVEADFGQTLHTWGAGEGAYVELPFLGPSTSRDAVGVGVDLALNPFIVIFQEPQTYIGLVAYIIDAMGTRYELGDTIDSILYQSADSYAQARSIYLQNRRYELGISAEDLYLDPYLEFYDDPYEDF